MRRWTVVDAIAVSGVSIVLAGDDVYDPGGEAVAAGCDDTSGGDYGFWFFGVFGGGLGTEGGGAVGREETGGGVVLEFLQEWDDWEGSVSGCECGLGYCEPRRRWRVRGKVSVA